jgi:hypothetical protein
MFVITNRRDRKISPMSWSKRILITLAGAVALMLIPVVALVIYDLYERVQVALFNNAHPMLQEMSSLPYGPYNEREQGMAAILLKRLPLGSTRSEALAIFSTEGMKCERPVGTAQWNMLVCYVTSPRVRWHIEVQFDKNDRVSGGRVLILKA